MKPNALPFLALSTALLAGCGTMGSSFSPKAAPDAAHPDAAHLQPNASAAKSAKRGIAYDLASPADLAALAPGIAWWYNWGSAPNGGIPAGYNTTYGVTYYPMLWNGSFNKSNVESFLKSHPEIKYLLVLNEPNVSGQATCGNNQPYCSPQDAAALWPQFEAVANDTGTQIVGPQITYGQEPNYTDPVAWMDAFLAAYKNNNGGRSPRIDYLGFHWYDYGLDSQLTRLNKYGKPYWVTEFANWHSQNDGAQIDTLAKQEAQMQDMVNTCETRSDVFHYAWFTGRVSPDPHFDSLLAGQGQLTALGQFYLSLPFTAAASTAGPVTSSAVLIDAGSSTAQGSYKADTGASGGSTATSGNTVAIASGDTATQAVYQSNRYGNFTYTLAGFTPGSAHSVKLHFAETYWTAAGARLFNVLLNSTTVLSNFDIVQTAGAPNKAVIQSLNATADTNGRITLQFQTVKDNAQINAIEIN